MRIAHMDLVGIKVYCTHYIEYISAETVIETKTELHDIDAAHHTTYLPSVA